MKQSVNQIYTPACKLGKRQPEERVKEPFIASVHQSKAKMYKFIKKGSLRWMKGGAESVIGDGYWRWY